MEKRRLMHYYTHVKYVDNTLFYFHDNGTRLDYVVDKNANPFQIGGKANMGNLFKLSMNLDSNIGK